LCEIIRGAFLWIIWNERNKIIFQNKKHSSIRALENSIISLPKHWCRLKGENYSNNLHMILPTDVHSLSVQITEHLLRIMPPEERDLSGREHDLIEISLA
jgi:hypothetical protein